MKTLHYFIIITIGMAVMTMSSFNDTFAQNVTNSSNPISPIPSSILHSPVPTLTPYENQSLTNVALSIPDLQKWSHDWKYVDTGFLGNNKLGIAGGFEWQYAIVHLKAPSSSAPIPCDNDWWAWIEIDMTTMKVVQATYPTMESHQCEVAMGGGPGTSSVIVPIAKSPLKQFKSGVAADDVKCGQGLQLVIKTKDGSPACARPHTAQKLVERKWGWAMQPVNSIKPLPYRIINLENNTEMITFDNQTYYSEMPNYNETSYVHPVQISFHDVNFTLFPPGFRGGLPVGGCSGQYYWADVKFADGTSELLHIYGGTQSCADSVPIMLSNHILPQAGLTFSDGKMRLLVRDENQAGKNIVLQKPSGTGEPFPHCNPSPAKEKLIREKQQILTNVLEDEEKKYGGFENRTQNLPWSTIGYDCIDNALEIGILPHYFNSDLLPKYFEKIRSIVGNTIDVVLSPEDYATPV